MTEPTRREKLQAMLEQDPQDMFLRYGLAMEFLKEGNLDEGVARLEAIAQDDPDYQAAYFQLGQVLAAQGRSAEAKAWLERGIAAARRIGNDHAASEMHELLNSL